MKNKKTYIDYSLLKDDKTHFGIKNKKCKLCNRPLKSFRSKYLGYGPTCFKKAGFFIKKGNVVKKLNYY